MTLERERQQELVEDGTIPWSCDNPYKAPAQKLAVLLEEVGEVAELVNKAERQDLAAVVRHLENELVQVAAVAVAWLESIDLQFDGPSSPAPRLEAVKQVTRAARKGFGQTELPDEAA